jgi:hypothetical protein
MLLGVFTNRTYRLLSSQLGAAARNNVGRQSALSDSDYQLVKEGKKGKWVPWEIIYKYDRP